MPANTSPFQETIESRALDLTGSTPTNFDAGEKHANGDLMEPLEDRSYHAKPQGFMERLYSTIAYGGTVANVYTLASATLGAGIVSVPGGFRESGIVVSSVLLFVVYLCTVYSIRLLAIAKDKTGLRSYEEMAQGLLGRGWDYFTAALMFLFCWGTCVGYVISVEDLLKPILQIDDHSGKFVQSTTFLQILTGLIWLLGMLTLSLPKEINSLRYASTVGVSMIVFFVGCMIWHSATHGLKDGFSPDLKLVNSGLSGVNGLSLFIFAFVCQVNVFEIYNEMARPSPRRITYDSMISMGLVALLNWLSGFFGYCDFVDEVESSILLKYKPRESIVFMIAYIGICIKLCVGFAICIQPSRDAIYYCFNMGKTSDVTSYFNWAVSGALCVAALICGLAIPNITIVFTLLGGVCGGFLGFLFPAYFYLFAGDFTYEKVGFWNYFGCSVLLIGASVAVVFGTASAVYEVVYA